MSHGFWMAVSGSCGLAFFFMANFTHYLERNRVFAGFAQIAVNVFVFVSWGAGFLQSSGFLKFIAFWGVVVPIVMAAVTTVRVIIPWLRRIY